MRLIDADALVERYGEPCHSFLDVIEDMPTIEAVPVVHARWIMHNFGAVCSACNKKFHIDTCHPAIMPSAPWWRFCPNCGSKMDGDPDDSC